MDSTPADPLPDRGRRRVHDGEVITVAEEAILITLDNAAMIEDKYDVFPGTTEKFVGKFFVGEVGSPEWYGYLSPTAFSNRYIVDEAADMKAGFFRVLRK